MLHLLNSFTTFDACKSVVLQHKRTVLVCVRPVQSRQVIAGQVASEGERVGALRCTAARLELHKDVVITLEQHDTQSVSFAFKHDIEVSALGSCAALLRALSFTKTMSSPSQCSHTQVSTFSILRSRGLAGHSDAACRPCSTTGTHTPCPAAAAALFLHDSVLHLVLLCSGMAGHP
jgi:hypothetical protein